jgi:DNA-binding transcriptional regulator YiaG
MAKETTTLIVAIGGTRFSATMPLASVSTRAVEARYLAAFERWVLERLCANGQASSEGLKYLRQRARMTEADLAQHFGVSEETVSRWENGASAVPVAAWQFVVFRARERMRTHDGFRIDPGDVVFADG